MSNKKSQHRVTALMESVESRRLFAVVAAIPLGDVNTTSGAASTRIDLSKAFTSTTVTGTVVRFPVAFGGLSANIDLGLFDKQTPKTVENFLKYVNSGSFNTTFAHRLVKDFVLQMGGYTYPSGSHIKQFSPVVNEFSTSPHDAQGKVNTVGTVAMAKTGGDPDSATSEFFVNLGDNSANLDSQNGGFTTFGRVLGKGLDVVNQIAALPTTKLSAPFDEIPLANYDGMSNIAQQNVVYFDNVSVVKPVSFQVTSSDNTLVTPLIDSKGVLSLTYADTLTGTSQITVKATDLDGATTTSTFNVSIGDGANLAVFYNGQRLNPNDVGAINFGVLQLGQSATQKLLLQNTGNKTLTLGSAQATNGFSVVGNLPSSLPSGEQANITVGINTTVGGIQNGQLSIPVNTPSGVLALSVTAEVRLLVTLGSKTAKSIVFKEASGGTTATLSITGSGTATVEFTGNKISQKSSGGVTTISGASGVGAITLKGTNAKSIFNLTGKGGDGIVTVTQITSSDASGSADIKLGQINAPAAQVTSGLTLGDTAAGGTSLSKLVLGGLVNADVFIGSSSSTKEKVSLSLGKVANSTINSRIPVTTLAASKWVDTDTVNAVAAPSIDALTIGSDFGSSINLDAKGNLGPVAIKGSIAGGTWSVPGKTKSIAAKAISTKFQATLTGAVGSITTTGDLGGEFRTGSVGTITVGGKVSDWKLTSAAGSLGTLAIKGTMTGSVVDMGSSIGDVTAVSMTTSQIYSGVQSRGGAVLPTNRAQFVSATKSGPVSKIRSITLLGPKKGFAFSNSAISAAAIGTLTLGRVETAPAGGGSNGIAASAISSLSLTTDAPQAIKTTGILRASDLPQLQAKAGTTRTFVINVITA